MSQLTVVILAAGQGKRMYSDRPKVLHPLAGRPLVQHVVDAAAALDPAETIVVVGHGADQVRAGLADAPVRLAEQARQLGTGDAVAAGLAQAGAGAAGAGEAPVEGHGDDLVLVLYGDVPLIRPDTLRRLVALAGAGRLALLTMELADPTGYGRVLRDAAGRVQAIVEEKDADAAQAAVGEVNTGILAAPAARLREWLGRLGNDNAQGEYYLTDVIAMAVADGLEVRTAQPARPHEVMGVNNRLQLAELERVAQLEQARELLLAGVTVADPARLDVRGRLLCGRDVSLDVNVVCEGTVRLGDGVRVGPNVLLRNVEVGAGTEILANSVVEEAVIGAGARIGPFARVRPETSLADGVHVGNFVEVKKSAIGAGSKVNHLSYVGDSDIGARVNVGAGTITCNYDGANKHRTVIGDDAFIGSDSQLVAPVEVGAGATIGAGSTIVRDAPAGELTLSRAEQTTRQGWQRPRKPGR